jgi:hypothetical protein
MYSVGTGGVGLDGEVLGETGVVGLRGLDPRGCLSQIVPMISPNLPP